MNTDTAPPRLSMAATAAAVLLLSLLAAPPSPACGELSWRRIGPDTVRVSTVAVDPARPGLIFAGTGEGVWRTEDHGGTWRAANTGLGSRDVGRLVIPPSSPGTLYAFTAGGIFKTVDQGLNWIPVTDEPADIYLDTLTVDPVNPIKFLAAGPEGVLISRNEGRNWTTANTGLAYITGIYALALDPLDPDTVYCGTFPHVLHTGESLGGGVFKTENSGRLWLPRSGGLTNPSVLSLAVAPSEPAVIYAGTEKGGVYRSTNGAVGWEAANSGLTRTSVTALAVAPADPDLVYAVTVGRGVFVSTDGGQVWNEGNTGLAFSSVNQLVVDPGSPAAAYAATDEGVFVSSGIGGGDGNPPLAPAPSQQVYRDGDRLLVTLPELPAGMTPYLAVAIPGGAAFLITGTNEIAAFDGQSLPPWSGAETVLDLPLGAPAGVLLPTGLYTVFLLQVPEGVDPLEDTDSWELGSAVFTVEQPL